VKRKVHTLDDDDDGDEVGLDGDMVDAQWGDNTDGMVGALVQVEEIHDGLGEFSEWIIEVVVAVYLVMLMRSVPCLFLRTNTGRHDLLVSSSPHHQ
jgi:hypothetical protein